MLVNYLENCCVELHEKKEKYRALNSQYKKFYSRDIRDEMNLLKRETAKKEYEIREHLYDELAELALIKIYFPDLYDVFMEDDCIGKLIKKKDWLLIRKETEKQKAKKEFDIIRKKRKELIEAKKFIIKWPREKIDSKSLTATWPALKNQIKGTLDKEDVIEKIRKIDSKLKREGWLVLINKSMIELPLKRFMKKITDLNLSEQTKKTIMEKSKGKGSVKEYEALKEYNNVKRKKKKYERILRHLLIASRDYLADLKKTASKPKTDGILLSIAGSIKIKKIDEKKWLADMRSRLE